MAEIPLSNGMTAFVDDDDLPAVQDRRWFAHKSSGRIYVASKRMRGGKVAMTFLHRALLDCERERITFRNGNPLDCRRENLVVGGERSAPAKSYARGSLGEALVIADLARHGHDVFVPIAGHTAADLISVKPGSRPIRWQVKFRSFTRGTSSLVVSLSGVHARKGGYDRKAYDLAEIDGFAVCCAEPEAVFYVPVGVIDESKGSFSLCMGPNAGQGAGAKNAALYVSPDISGTISDTTTC